MFMTFVDLLASCDHRLKLKTVHVLSALAFDIRSITGCSCLFFRPRVTIRVQVSFLRPGAYQILVKQDPTQVHSLILDIEFAPYSFSCFSLPTLIGFTSCHIHSFILLLLSTKNSLHKYPSSIAISFLVPGIRNLRLEILESKTRREIF